MDISDELIQILEFVPEKSEEKDKINNEYELDEIEKVENVEYIPSIIDNVNNINKQISKL